MNISLVTIENFRAIKKATFSAKGLSLLIGNNGTGKTSVLEAIHYALSPRFTSSRIKHTDFCEGEDNPIKIGIKFAAPFTANLPDGFASQAVECDQVYLEIKKRERAGAGKAFSEAVVVTHHVLPNRPKDNDKGWEKARKTRDKPFQFDERLLSLPQVELVGFPKSFYFAKDRGKQLKKGFNSSVSSVFDDFNWRFAKEVRKESITEGTESFHTKKATLENEIVSKIDKEAIKKSFVTLNDKLKEFDLEPVSLSFIDGHAPFDSAFLSKEIKSLDLPISNLGSGEEMLISLLFLETLAALSKEKMIVLIDEPELHLHPYLQEQFAAHLKDMASENQVMVSTHSPYFFKNCLSSKQVELLITSLKEGLITVTNTGSSFGILPWSPSWGEINFLAYGLPTIEFHDELYGRLHDLFVDAAIDETQADGRSRQRDFDNHLKTVIDGVVIKAWIPERAGVAQDEMKVTQQTYIRNKIHHPENSTMQGEAFTNDDLRKSIEQMLKCLKTTT